MLATERPSHPRQEVILVPSSDPRNTPGTPPAADHQRGPERRPSDGRWVGVVALLAVACCALPLLVSAGVFAGLAGVGVGGLAGGVVGASAALVVVLYLAHRRRSHHATGCRAPDDRARKRTDADGVGHR